MDVDLPFAARLGVETAEGDDKKVGWIRQDVAFGAAHMHSGVDNSINSSSYIASG